MVEDEQVEKLMRDREDRHALLLDQEFTLSAGDGFVIDLLHYAMFRNVGGGFEMPKQPEHGRAIGGLDAVLAQVEADMAALVSRLITTGVPIKRPTKVRSNALAV